MQTKRKKCRKEKFGEMTPNISVITEQYKQYKYLEIVFYSFTHSIWRLPDLQTSPGSWHLKNKK